MCVAAKNIALGYMDTMREFGRLGGTAYGILPDENSFMQDFAAEYQAQLSAAISRAPTLALTEALARQHKHYPAASPKIDRPHPRRDCPAGTSGGDGGCAE